MMGYKVFDTDWRCLGFQYEVGKTFKHDGEIIPCESGFHFCKNLVDCFNYYSFNPQNKVAEIEATGNVKTDDDTKYVTDEIKIIRELTWIEVLMLCNTGKNNTGYRNSGNRNTGSQNSGDLNTGNENIGYRNTGDYNSGNWNTGIRNSGNFNSGNSNSGYYNSGNWNSGDYNSGTCNTGDTNSGYRNSGHFNSGDYNTGDRNVGYRNSGDSNTGNENIGYRNTGDYNSGNRNTGEFNSIDYETGVFNNATSKTIRIFNNHISSDRIYEITKNLGYIAFKRNFTLNEWICYDDMTNEEKEKYPDAKFIDGYLKKYTYKKACKNAWNHMTNEEKEEFKKLPNFDPIIFEDITGIDVDECTDEPTENDGD